MDELLLSTQTSRRLGFALNVFQTALTSVLVLLASAPSFSNLPKLSTARPELSDVVQKTNPRGYYVC